MFVQKHINYVKQFFIFESFYLMYIYLSKSALTSSKSLFTTIYMLFL